MSLCKASTRTVEVGFFVGIFLASLFLSYNIHIKRDFFSWKSELWADRSGYYVYLPATFLYGWDTEKAPEKIDEKTGHGFWMDPFKGKFRTKYPAGVAVMLAPFFYATHLISMTFDIPEEGGFSPLYHWMIDMAAVVYLVLALMLLRKVLQRYFSSLVQYLTLFFIYVGTNLFYYTLDDGSMSHVYSFFLFSLFLFALIRWLDTSRYGFFLLLIISGSLAVLIRPTNILLFSLLFVWDITSWKSLWKRIGRFFKPAHLIAFLVILFLVLLPQFLYWKYYHGSYIAYTYGEEGFTNWNQPYFLEIWFSPLNGLFTYSPLVILLLIGIGLMIAKREINGWVSLALFMLVSYICASWQTWYFGCSFGQRSFVEYYSILAIPLAYLIQWASEQKRYVAGLVVLILLVLFSWFNLRLTYVYEKCFFGSTWDWDTYHRQLDRAGIPLPGSPEISYINDFENQALNSGTAVTQEVVRTGIWSATFNEYHEFCCHGERWIWDFPPDQYPVEMEASGWVYFPDSVPEGIKLVFSVEREGVSLKYEGSDLSTLINRKDSWQPFTISYAIPPELKVDTRLLFYIWNPGKIEMFIDDLEIRYK